MRLIRDRALAQNQQTVVASGVRRLSEVPEAPISANESRVTESEKILKELRALEANAAAQVRQAMEFETKAEAEFKQLSESDARFVGAAAELESFISDDACSLCGHHHGTKRALEAAINAVREHRLSSSSGQRAQFERASTDRRDKAAAYARLQNEARSAEANLIEARRTLDNLRSQRQAALEVVRESLKRYGLQPLLSTEVLASLRDDLESKVSRLEKEITSARQAEEESRQTSSDLERELAERAAEADAAQASRTRVAGTNRYRTPRTA